MGPKGRGREREKEVCSTLTKGTFSSRLLLSNQVKGCSPSVAHSLPLPLGPALLNLSIFSLPGETLLCNLNLLENKCYVSYFLFGRGFCGLFSK